MEYNAANNRETLLPWDIFIPGQKNRRYYMPYKVLKEMILQLEKLSQQNKDN
jgi:NADH:ubiquinone oxidoreductase subunit B-like Fe-S oxidoreductase